MRKKIAIPAIIVIVAAICVIWYFTPKVFGKRVNPENVDHIEVFDGTTGMGFVIQNEEDITNIVTTIQSKPVQRDGISLFRMGYKFKLSYVDGNGKEICSPFIINSDNLIRQDPFFYDCKEGLNLEESLRELEEEAKR